jgi:hypothetical protein
MRHGLFSFLALLSLSFLVFGQAKKDSKDTNKAKPEAEKAKPEAEKAKPEAEKTKPESGQGKLEWKFKENTPFFQEITTKTVQEMKIAQQTINQTQTQTFWFSWKPTKYDKDKKTWTIVQTIEGVKLDIQIGGNTISYDSAKDTGQNNPLAEFFKQLVGSEFTITVDKDMKIVGKIEGKEKFIDKLTKANAQMEALLKEILNDDAFKQMVDPTFSALPTVEEFKKKEWTREATLNMGPIGKYKTRYTYKYEGKDPSNKELDKISVTAKLDYTKPDAKVTSSLPFKIEDAKLESKKSSGTIRFNTKVGQIASSQMDLEMTGTLKIAIGGTTTDVQLTQTQTVNVKTADKLTDLGLKKPST